MDMSYYLQTTINYLLKDDEMNIRSSALQSLLIYESMDSESQRKPLGREVPMSGMRSFHCVGNCPPKLEADLQSRPRGHGQDTNRVKRDILAHSTEKSWLHAQLNSGPKMCHQDLGPLLLPALSSSDWLQSLPPKWKQDGGSNFIPYIFSDFLISWKYLFSPKSSYL